MEIRLEGRIKTKVKDFGFIHCDSVNFDYYFHNSSFDEESNFEIGDLVSFSLRQNRGREGNHAYDLKKITLFYKYYRLYAMANHCTDLGQLMAVGMIIAFFWAMSIIEKTDKKKTDNTKKICKYCRTYGRCVCE
jgi:cold shock CspA family protein